MSGGFCDGWILSEGFLSREIFSGRIFVVGFFPRGFCRGDFIRLPSKGYCISDAIPLKGIVIGFLDRFCIGKRYLWKEGFFVVLVVLLILAFYHFQKLVKRVVKQIIPSKPQINPFSKNTTFEYQNLLQSPEKRRPALS